MGRPIIVKPRPPGGNRRDFFRKSGAAVAFAGASGVTLGVSSLAVRAAAGAGGMFQHGVASGDPLSDRVILWTRVSPVAGQATVQVDYVVATDVGFTNLVSRGRIKTNPARDYTVKVDAAGLSPNTTYYYKFTAEGTDSPVGRTKTLPVGTADSLRIAVVSCSNFAYGYFNVYRRIAERADLDMVVHLGDYIYEYGSGQYGSVRACEPANEIVTLTDYRTRHAQHKRDADSQEMHRQHPLVAIWDDHETANNSWKDGAENHQPATEGDWNVRVANALQAYYEWMPVRIVDVANPRKNNRSYSYGNLVDLIMLEERLNARSEQLTTNINNASGYFVQSGPYADASREMLGAEEENWLAAELRGSTAKWKLIGQGVMFAQLKGVAGANSAGGGVFVNSDQWDGYQPARDRVYSMIKGDATHAAVPNVVIMTGDIHSSWAADLSQDPNNADVASGGYDPVTGRGSRAVEFVGTSVTSPGLTDPTGALTAALMVANPHFKYINLEKRGYMLVDVTSERAVCEWWHIDTVSAPSTNQAFAIALQVRDGTQHLVPATQTTPRANPPRLAP